MRELVLWLLERSRRVSAGRALADGRVLAQMVAALSEADLERLRVLGEEMVAVAEAEQDWRASKALVERSRASKEGSR